MNKNKQKPEIEKVLVDKNSIEAMAESIVEIARAARAMETRLTRRAIVVLIQDKTGGARGVSHENINKVLNAIQELNVYVKGK